MKLLDASAIFNLFINGKFSVLLSAATIPLAKHEIGNILWKNYRVRNIISKREAEEAGSVLFDLIDSMEQVVPVPGSTLSLALEEGITFYDSSYLKSAIDSGYDFVTDDLKLGKIAIPLVHTQKSSDL